MKYYSAIKGENLVICNNTEQEVIRTTTICSHSDVEYKKADLTKIKIERLSPEAGENMRRG